MVPMMIMTCDDDDHDDDVDECICVVPFISFPFALPESFASELTAQAPAQQRGKDEYSRLMTLACWDEVGYAG